MIVIWVMSGIILQAIDCTQPSLTPAHHSPIFGLAASYSSKAVSKADDHTYVKTVHDEVSFSTVTNTSLVCACVWLARYHNTSMKYRY